VYVVGEDEKIERRTIRLGPMSHGLRIVREGLSAEDRLVTSGLQLVRPGAPVTATPADEFPWVEDGELPETFQPVPREQWLSVDLQTSRSPADIPATGNPATASPQTRTPEI